MDATGHEARREPSEGRRSPLLPGIGRGRGGIDHGQAASLGSLLEKELQAFHYGGLPVAMDPGFGRTVVSERRGTCGAGQGHPVLEPDHRDHFQFSGDWMAEGEELGSDLLHVGRRSGKYPSVLGA
jgi:hypothetical protein